MRSRSLLLLLILISAPALLRAQAPVDTASHSPMGDAVQHPEKPTQPSKALKVSVPGHPELTLSLADLQALPQTAVAVFNAHTKQNESYSGPRVAEVLAKAGAVLSETTQHGFLDSYVLAAGTDGYFVVFSGAELQPSLNKSEAIVAIAEAGQPLTRTGTFQLVDAADQKPARWVRNLQTLTIRPVQMAQ